MSETTDTTPETTETADTSDATTGAPEATDDRGSNEARKYRKRAQEAEAERDSLRERLSTMQRNEIQRMAGDKLVDPTDLWATGATVDDYLDDDGNLDPDKLDTAIGVILEAKPHWRQKSGLPNAREVQGGEEIRGGYEDRSFSSAFRPRDRR